MLSVLAVLVLRGWYDASAIEREWDVKSQNAKTSEASSFDTFQNPDYLVKYYITSAESIVKH